MIMITHVQPHLPPQTVPTNLFTSHSGPSNTLPVLASSAAPPTRRFTSAELASRAFGNQQVPPPLVASTHSQIPVLLPVRVSYTLPNMTPVAQPNRQHAMPRVSVTMPYNKVILYSMQGLEVWTPQPISTVSY